MLNLEGEVYKMIGADANLIDLYMSSHLSWKWKTGYQRGVGNG